jgi:uncharacterized repeat protein (TIGR03803 family)
LYNFTATSGAYATNSDGTGPQARLILLSNKLYGTAAYGGNSGSGTIFAINTDGTGFTNLYSFTATSSNPPYTNSDGEYPLAGLLLVGNTLYGTAQFGGGSGNGTVFKVNTDGTGFTALHSFTASSGSQQTNSDGTGPEAGLVFLNNALYGTASYGGSSGNGTVFKVNMDGTGFSTLHSFTAASGVLSTNTDGAYPLAGLFLSGTTLYGTAQLGGNSGSGTVFKLNMDGTGFTTLYSFTGNSDGSSPYAGLILSSNILYGTAMTGGSSGNGTVFSLSLAVSNLPQQPLLTITRSQSNLLLTWPTNFTGFTLQSTTNFSSPAWTNVSPGPVVINGQNTVTNPIFGPRKFFRLVH